MSPQALSNVLTTLGHYSPDLRAHTSHISTHSTNNTYILKTPNITQNSKIVTFQSDLDRQNKGGGGGGKHRYVNQSSFHAILI